MRLTNGRQDLPGGLSLWRCSDGFLGTYSDRPAGRRDLRDHSRPACIGR